MKKEEKITIFKGFSAREGFFMNNIFIVFSFVDMNYTNLKTVWLNFICMTHMIP